MAMNDELAELVARHPGRIYGLASVDGYDGDNSAREAERAITELGLRGLFVDCARDDLLIDAPQGALPSKSRRSSGCRYSPIPSLRSR
jgi:hypothetical protein